MKPPSRPACSSARRRVRRRLRTPTIRRSTCGTAASSPRISLLNGRPHSITDPTVIDPFVAAFARPYLRNVLSFSNVKALICWELSDKYSDLLQDQQRPLPFDANMQPKLLANEIESAIQDRQPSWLINVRGLYAPRPRLQVLASSVR
jgi:hypothetical protein